MDSVLLDAEFISKRDLVIDRHYEFAPEHKDSVSPSRTIEESTKINQQNAKDFSILKGWWEVVCQGLENIGGGAVSPSCSERLPVFQPAPTVRWPISGPAHAGSSPDGGGSFPSGDAVTISAAPVLSSQFSEDIPPAGGRVQGRMASASLRCFLRKHSEQMSADTFLEDLASVPTSPRP